MILPEIRFCTQEDLPQLLEVNRTSPHAWSDEVVVKDMTSEGAGLSYLGAFSETNARLVGFSVLGDEKSDALLMNLVVAPEFRRRGIGLQLAVATAECAAQMGFSSLSLRVRATNAGALALYRSLGFRGDAKRESFYSDGDVAYYMSAKLPLELPGEESVVP